METDYDDSFEPPAPVMLVALGRPGASVSRIVRFLVDTGADGTVVPPAFARSLGLPRTGSVDVAGVTGSPTRAPTFAGAMTLGNREILVEVIAAGTEPILGRDVLAEVVLQLDGPRRRLRVSAPRRRRAP